VAARRFRGRLLRIFRLRRRIDCVANFPLQSCACERESTPHASLAGTPPHENFK
jgi:hypothetical protein